MQVIRDLLMDLLWSLFQHRLQYVPGNAIAGGQVLRVTAAANPTERPEAVVETHRPHDVLHITRVPEFFTVLATDIGSGAFAFQQEGVAVVEEIHACAGERVDRFHLPFQAVFNALFER
jgi:hypothetical protein